MAEEIVMPRLSDSMEEGTILKWMKGVGDEVALGDELVEIETDKANMVFEADAAGTLIEIVAGEGDTLPIGEVIARVGEASEAGPEAGAPTVAMGAATVRVPRRAVLASLLRIARRRTAPPPPLTPRRRRPTRPRTKAEHPSRAEPEPAPTPTQPVQAADSGDGDGRVKASPLARRIARERGVDLATLSGSGPGGRIIKADVEGAGAAAAPAAAPTAQAAPPAGAAERPETAKGTVAVIELTKLQQTVSRRMAESKATAPHFYLQAEVDMTRAVEARAALKAAAGPEEVVPSFNDMVIKAAAIALRRVPARQRRLSRRPLGALFAGQRRDRGRRGRGAGRADDLRRRQEGPAPDRDRGAGARRAGARANDHPARALGRHLYRLQPRHVRGLNFHPVINSPQAAILAVGAIAEAPVVRDGELAVARLMGVTLACDHRILYGADGAEFLARVRALLTEPLGLAL